MYAINKIDITDTCINIDIYIIFTSLALECNGDLIAFSKFAHFLILNSFSKVYSLCTEQFLLYCVICYTEQKIWDSIYGKRGIPTGLGKPCKNRISK